MCVCHRNASLCGILKDNENVFSYSVIFGETKLMDVRLISLECGDKFANPFAGLFSGFVASALGVDTGG